MFYKLIYVKDSLTLEVEILTSMTNCACWAASEDENKRFTGVIERTPGTIKFAKQFKVDHKTDLAHLQAREKINKKG